MPLFGIHGGKYRTVISADSQRAVYDGAVVRFVRVASRRVASRRVVLYVVCRRQRMDDRQNTPKGRNRRGRL